ncbi:MAG: nucleoside kinase, partial [Lachnospiraceae bacterium]|nr:nucleoside kinase [Lachnospiraceae bacterium]
MAIVDVMGQKREIDNGTTYEEIVNEFQGQYDNLIALVSVNGKIKELFKTVKKDCTIEFFTLKDPIGHKTYVRSATMLFLKAVNDLFGKAVLQKCRVQFSVGNGTYIYVNDGITVNEKNADVIKARMQQLVDAKVPYMKRAYGMDNAMELFEREGMVDKIKLLKYRRSSYVNVYEMDGYYDYYYGYMLPNAGYVKLFDVLAYDEGFMLVLPTQKEPTVLQPFVDRPKLFKTLKEAEKWGQEIGVENVGDLNDCICNGSLSDMILVHEAQQERRIGEIARDIVSKNHVKFVMIAGPSSSGKTSFSHRLSIQLRTLGKVPHPIGLDDYYKDRQFCPRDEDGNYDFECLEAIDVELFNQDMSRLLAGERVELPTFSFKTGKREYNGKFMQLGKDDILVVEGIHGLNPKTSTALPDESKYKIYISALTSLNVDAHNRIPTTDGRLLRRMVRDARTRNTDARQTMEMWASVRRGEEKYIFPFQEEADSMFNSALIYELAVIKQFAEPLL